MTDEKMAELEREAAKLREMGIDVTGRVSTQAWGDVLPGSYEQARSISIDDGEEVIVGGAHCVRMADYIAGCVVAVPKLIAEVRRLRAEALQRLYEDMDYG